MLILHALHCPDPDFVKRSADWISASVGELSLPRRLQVAASQPCCPDVLQTTPQGYTAQLTLPFSF